MDVILTYPQEFIGFEGGGGVVYVLMLPHSSMRVGEFVSNLAKGINRVLLFPFPSPSFVGFEFIPVYIGGCVNLSRNADLWILFQCLLRKNL